MEKSDLLKLVYENVVDMRVLAHTVLGVSFEVADETIRDGATGIMTRYIDVFHNMKYQGRVEVRLTPDGDKLRHPVAVGIQFVDVLHQIIYNIRENERQRI